MLLTDPPTTTDPPESAAETVGLLGLRAAVAAAFLAAVAVPFGLLLVLVRAQWGPLYDLDVQTVGDLHTFAVAQPLYVTVMKGFSFVGSAPFYWMMGAALVIWLLRRRAVYPALFVVIALGGGGLLNLGVKTLVDRVRPVWPDPVAHTDGFSFPSGHAQGAIVGYGVLFLVLAPALTGWWRRLLLVSAAGMVLTIGFSRIALGVHYPSDVLGGFLLGAAWLAALLVVFGRTVGRHLTPTSPAWRGLVGTSPATGRAAGPNIRPSPIRSRTRSVVRGASSDDRRAGRTRVGDTTIRGASLRIARTTARPTVSGVDSRKPLGVATPRRGDASPTSSPGSHRPPTWLAPAQDGGRFMGLHVGVWRGRRCRWCPPARGMTERCARIGLIPAG